MIAIGQTVTVNYTGWIKKTGEVFDTTEGRDPFTFKIGEQNVIHGFQTAILNKEVGDKFTVDIPKNMAYGEYEQIKISEVSKDILPGEVEEGQILVARGTNELDSRVIVTEIRENTVILDGNHPLAGHDLTFELEIISVE